MLKNSREIILVLGIERKDRNNYITSKRALVNAKEYC